MSDKEAILQLVDTECQNLWHAIEGLDDEQLCRVWLGGWSVKDIVAHLIGWERVASDVFQRLTRGERATPEGVDYSDEDAWNARFAREMAEVAPETALAAWRRVHSDYLRAASSLPEERFAEGRTARRFLEEGGAGHLRTHAKQIEEWREREGI